MRDAGQTIDFMDHVRATGCAFALDDFGAGATGFRYFRDFRFDMVKIDGAFVRGVHAARDAQVLVECLSAVARHFEMLTVAEQVENEADAAWLRGPGSTACRATSTAARRPSRRCRRRAGARRRRLSAAAPAASAVLDELGELRLHGGELLLQLLELHVLARRPCAAAPAFGAMPVAKGANIRSAFSNHSMFERASASKFASAGLASNACRTCSRIASWLRAKVSIDASR